MVLEEGRKNGIGIWEIENYNKLEGIIRRICEEFIKKQNFIDSEDVSVENIIIFGSFGSGMGVPGKSDLDILVTTSYVGDIRSNNYSNFMKHLSGQVKSSESHILSEFSEFTELDVYVFPHFEMRKRLRKMSVNEPVEYYYDLTEGSKKSIF